MVKIIWWELRSDDGIRKISDFKQIILGILSAWVLSAEVNCFVELMMTCRFR